MTFPFHSREQALHIGAQKLSRAFGANELALSSDVLLRLVTRQRAPLQSNFQSNHQSAISSVKLLTGLAAAALTSRFLCISYLVLAVSVVPGRTISAVLFIAFAVPTALRIAYYLPLASDISPVTSLNQRTLHNS